MSAARTAAVLAATCLVLAGCGTAAGGESDATTSEPATARGLAAAVLHHIGEDQVEGIEGGLLDMEDQRALELQLSFAGRDTMSVSASDPDYLPGDRGPDDCEKEGVERARWGTSECRILDDGTVMQLIRSNRGFDPGNRDGSAAMLMANGPRGYVQIMLESYDATPPFDPAVLKAVAADPLVGWHTSPEMNAAGEDLDDFQQHDRVDR